MWDQDLVDFINYEHESPEFIKLYNSLAKRARFGEFLIKFPPAIMTVVSTAALVTHTLVQKL